MGDDSKTGVLEEGDFVVVFGATIQNDGKGTYHRIIAKVLAVGVHDAFLQCSTSQRNFKRPVKNCYKIPKHSNSLKQVKSPSLGDLVLSLSGGIYRAEKRIVGILIELIDKPPNDLDARLLCGKETHVVPFNTLIVMEGR